MVWTDPVAHQLRILLKDISTGIITGRKRGMYTAYLKIKGKVSNREIITTGSEIINMIKLQHIATLTSGLQGNRAMLVEMDH